MTLKTPTRRSLPIPKFQAKGMVTATVMEAVTGMAQGTARAMVQGMVTAAVMGRAREKVTANATQPPIQTSASSLG
ncbi:MAG: hypothetical protein BCV62_20075 [Pseudomonas sp. K35]|uniref:Uncharacterized protein n=1 Tax=Stutzerimonas stutzeri TaxID=316 RepID=A0A0D7EBP9_STUST|nr:hypothetical protein LO50_02355 [Stutzerimonas stutzeri]OCX98543.1 MAG: hypothetical protein BCV62_20075 [Pseudomonas sp. K35]